MEEVREQNLQRAMTMEANYRKLQDNAVAKDKFGYHNKLKAFGFEDTVSYEWAKDKYYLKNSNIPFENIDITELKQKRKEAVEQNREVLHIITGSGVFVYGGFTKDEDGEKIEHYNLPSVNPKFGGLIPKSFNCFRYLASDGLTGAEKNLEHYICAEAIYEDFTVQLWIDEQDSNKSWINIKEV